MQLTELLFQKVKGLPPQGQLALKPGYVALVSKSPTVRAALIAPIAPAPDDQRRLAEGQGPSRVGVGMIGGDGTPYRLLRELGGSRQLLKLDPNTRKYASLTDDQLEIDSFLRVECGMPSLDAYTNFFVLEVNELPSLRTKSAAAASEAYVDQAKVKALKDELELTQRFEGMQDRLFKVTQRLQELAAVKKRLDEAEAAANEAETQLGRSPWSPDQIADLTVRANAHKENLKKREEALADISKRRQRNAAHVPPVPEPFLTNPFFGGGIALGIAFDALAFALKTPWVALIGLAPYLAALVAVLRWIQQDEDEKESKAVAVELKEREKQTLRAFEAEFAPLKNAMKAANVEDPKELIALFREREEVSRQRDVARGRLQEVQSDPEVKRIALETPMLEDEKKKLDAEILRMGFTRGVADIENDLRQAMGISESKKGGQVPEAEVPRLLIERAAELIAAPEPELWGQIGQRLTAYLGALTDGRVVAAKRDEKGQLIVSAPDGRSGPYASLPPPLRDLVYSALRLTLLERIGSMKKLPVVIDDAFATFEPPKRMLVGKMLKGISTQTQVIHRVQEAPPAGGADLVLTA